MPTQLWRTTGTAGDDFVIGFTGSSVINAGDGDDYVLGDSGGQVAIGTSTSLATAANIDLASLWTRDENPFIANSTTTPHASLYVRADAGQTHFTSVSVGAGQTITVDIDFGLHDIGAQADVVVELYNSLGVMVASNNDGAVTSGAAGSIWAQDSFLVFTNTTGTAQQYTIRFRELDSGDGGVFEGGEDFVANISVTGHAVGPATAMSSDTVRGGTGDDTLAGQGGNDLLYGDAGSDNLIGGSGNDTLAPGAGDDVMDGGSGIDLAFYGDAVAGVRISLGVTGAQIVQGDDVHYLTAIENVTGSNYNDTLIGTNGANALNGGAGADVLYGGSGNDTLIGGEGNDGLDGGLGDDALNGGNGIDVASYALAPSGVEIALALLTPQITGGAGTDTLTGIENLSGSGFADGLSGDGGANIINGNGGNDSLFGGGGNDTLTGADGGDILVGEGGNDILNGGNGIDLASYFNNSAAVAVNLGIAAGQNTGSAGIDTLIGVENVAGTAFNDTLTGNPGANELSGGGGIDILNGRGGNDSLVGGDGNDVFRFDTPLNAATNVDYVNDFTGGADIIQLSATIFSAIGPGTLGAAAFQLGTAANDAGDRIIYDAPSGSVYYDADGTGVAAQVLFAHLFAGTVLTHSDFVVQAAAAQESAGQSSSMGFERGRAGADAPPVWTGTETNWAGLSPLDYFFS